MLYREDNLFRFEEIHHTQPKLRGTDKAEAVVVVTVVGTVVVTIRDATIPRIVVPATATQNAVRATLRLPPLSLHLYETYMLRLYLQKLTAV